MAMELTPNLILEILTVVVTVAVAFGVAKWRVDVTEKKVNELEKSFHEYQLTAAEKYVSSTHFVAFEAKIGASIDKLADRIDQALASRRTGR